jgi:four helix bundle protein
MAESFNKMRIWQIGYGLLMEIYEISNKFPDFEKYALAQQLIKAANSIIANIAESHGRYYYLDKVRVLYISRGEAEEVQSHLSVASGRNYISKEKQIDLMNRYESLIIKINEQIKYLRSKADNK